jgi:hypothetical protein
MLGAAQHAAIERFTLQGFDFPPFFLNPSKFCPHYIDALLFRLLLFFSFVSFRAFLKRESHHSGGAFGQLNRQSGGQAQQNPCVSGPNRSM